MKKALTLKVNGETFNLEVEDRRTLAEVIREDLQLLGTHMICEKGECGACTVLLDDEPVNACLMLAAQVNGHSIVTIEGLAPDNEVTALQQAFVEEGAIQCGYCTPGMILAAEALLRRKPEPSEEEIREGISGNLCRCTGYTKIIQAVQKAGVLRMRQKA